MNDQTDSRKYLHSQFLPIASLKHMRIQQNEKKKINYRNWHKHIIGAMMVMPSELPRLNVARA